MATPIKSSRHAALLATLDVLSKGRNLDQALREHLPAFPDPRDQGLVQRLAYNLLRWKLPLEFFAGQLLNKPLRSKDRDIYQLLLLGLSQLWPEPQAEHAVISETSQVARYLKKPWAVGLVNACLRNFLRNKNSLIKTLNPELALSHPSWLMDALKGDWPEDWQALASANNARPPLWLRINRRKISLKQYLPELDKHNIPWQLSPVAEDAVHCLEPRPVQGLPGYDEGWFSVQDPGAQMAAILVDPNPGERILDACAAPGGKTTHLLELESRLEQLLALDISGQRLERLKSNLQRLDMDCELLAADAAQPETWWDGNLFHKILLDAPCSATGVIRRHPDIKWLRTPEHVKELVQIQSRLLKALWPLLAPGGRLVYATCSVLSSENQLQLDQFRLAQQDALSRAFPKEIGLKRGPGRQLLPHLHGCDGFYYEVLEKC